MGFRRPPDRRSRQVASPAGRPLSRTPNNPTAAELRRLAIYSNYRALVDITTAGGYGILYGPNVLADGTVTGEEGGSPAPSA